MATIDSAPDGGKFRGIAASALGGTAGAWGNGDLLNVTLDASGELIVASATDAIGVILTTEGKRDSAAAGYKQVVAGAKYTVLKRATIVELDTFASPAVAAGDWLYAAAAGDVTTTPGGGAIFLGMVLAHDGSGMLLNLDVNGTPYYGTPAAVAAGDVHIVAIAGGAAGNHTVTGIAVGDSLSSVIFFDDLGGTAPAVTDLTAEFTVSAPDTIENAGHTDTTGGFLVIGWVEA